MRLSWQMNQKNKFGFYYNNKKREYTNAVSGTSHEALNTTYFFPFSDNLVQWSAPRDQPAAARGRLLAPPGNAGAAAAADSDIVDPLGRRRHRQQPRCRRCPATSS